MKDIDNLKKIALLIDADNAQLSKLKPIIDEISLHGHVIVKKAYGDWSSPLFKNWKDVLNELAIQPVQQFVYTTGKNATDAIMIIEAMDLLYTDKYDAFALVSSDSDFTMLATRLRAAEKYVFGIGEKKTPKSFKNACDDFILTELLNKEPAKKSEPKHAGHTETEKAPPAEIIVKDELAPLSMEEIYDLLDTAYEKYQDENGWVNVSSAGTFIKRIKPDFDTRSYGFSKLPDLIKHLSERYEMKRYKGAGTVTIIAYRKK